MACVAQEELGWLRQLRDVAGGVAGKVKPAWVDALCKRKPREAWQSFELADVMEQGMAREVTTSFITPPPRDAPSKHLLVERSQDRTEYVLSSETGEPLLLARSARGSQQVDIFVPTGGDPPVAVGPAFTLAADGPKHERWTLYSDRCECCEYLPESRACCSRVCRRELAHVRHAREDIGKGTLMYMEVDLPSLGEDGSPSVWCTRAGGDWGRLRLESKRPVWSPRIKSLTLDFYGRCSCASPKNFQLQAVGADGRGAAAGGPSRGRGGRTREAELLFGKIDDDAFVLDYKHPLGMAQAFAIALSTKDWQ